MQYVNNYCLIIRSESEQEEIKSILNDYIRMIFLSEPLTNQQKTNMQQILSTAFGINYFAKLVYQSKFEQKKASCLSENSFNDLLQMVFSVLLEFKQTREFYSDIRLITKALFYYYK